MIPDFQDFIRNVRLPKPGFYSSDGLRVIVPASETAKALVKIGSQLYVNSSDVQVHRSVSGVGGLDSGAVTNSTMYYLYAVPATPGFELVASTRDPDEGPVNVSNWSYLGAFPTDDGTSVLPPFQSHGGIMTGAFYNSAFDQTWDNSTAALKTIFVPTTAVSVYGRAYLSSINAAGDYGDLGAVTAVTGSVVRVASTTVNNEPLEFLTIPIVTPQQISGKVKTTTTVVITFRVYGWQEDLSVYP